MLQYTQESFMAKFVYYLYLILTLLSVVILCIESLPDLQENSNLYILENIVCIMFILEYTLSCYSAPNLRTFVTSAIAVVDVIILFPYYVNLINIIVGRNVFPLPILNMLRSVRVLKLAKYNKGIRLLFLTLYESLEYLLLLLTSISMACLGFANLIYIFEIDHGSLKFNSIPESLWYTIITVTGVGYGDIYPETWIGKILGGTLAIVGILLFRLPTPLMVNKFIECYYLRDPTKKMRSYRYERNDFGGT